MGFRIRPLKLGEATLDRKATLTLGRGWDESVTIAYLVWYLTDGKVHILVDTGVDDGRWALANRGVQIRQLPGERLTDHLARMGVAPGDIDLVICTHLHWDHCQNHGLFPTQEFIVQRREFIRAVNPLPVERGTYGWSKDQAAPFMQAASRFRLVEGDREICPGLSVILTPGHSPGLQGVLVEGDTTSYFLASDTVPLFENWEGAEPLPCGSYDSLEDYYRSFDRIRSLGVGQVLPGHDPRVLDQEEYR